MRRSVLSIDEALSRLLIVPTFYAHDVPDSAGKGWFMHLKPANDGGYKAYPGVYSTSFAIQLLSIDRNVAQQHRGLIINGFDYLARQFEDSEAIEQTGTPTFESKQSHKLDDVGHHDFALTFKLCAVLQAASSVASVVDSHEDFGRAVARHSDCMNRIADQLKSYADFAQEGARVRRAWPWHNLNVGGVKEVDVLPTAEVLLTLTHPSQRQSPRWLTEYAEVAAYLQSVVSTDDIALLLDRCIAANALLQLTERTTEQYLNDEDRAQLITTIRAVLQDPSNVPWQEVTHYSVPSGKGTLSHYKPWIWLFPRIQYLETLCLLDPSAASIPAARGVVDISNNIQDKKGVIFAHADPPALLASLRAAQLLILVKSTVLKLFDGKFRLRYEQIARLFKPFHIGWFGWFLIMFAIIYPYVGNIRLSLTGATVVQNSQQVLIETAWRLYSIWPIWLIVFVFLVLTGEGGLRKRVRNGILKLIMLTIFSMIIEVLAARH